MIESWLPVIFLFVIVAGMVVVRLWGTVISEALPLLRDWSVGRGAGDSRRRVGAEGPEDLDTVRRIEALEEQVQFLEALLRESPRVAPPRTGEKGAPPESSDDRHARSSSSR